MISKTKSFRKLKLWTGNTTTNFTAQHINIIPTLDF
jgi:hypothetical protein